MGSGNVRVTRFELCAFRATRQTTPIFPVTHAAHNLMSLGKSSDFELRDERTRTKTDHLNLRVNQKSRLCRIVISYIIFLHIH